MTGDTGVEAIAVIHILVFELKVEDIDKIGIRQPAICLEFKQNIGKNTIVLIPDGRMKFFAAFTVWSIVRVNGIRVQVRVRVDTVIYRRILEKNLAGNKWPDEKAAQNI